MFNNYRLTFFKEILDLVGLPITNHCIFLKILLIASVYQIKLSLHLECLLVSAAMTPTCSVCSSALVRAAQYVSQAL